MFCQVDQMSYTALWNQHIGVGAGQVWYGLLHFQFHIWCWLRLLYTFHLRKPLRREPRKSQSSPKAHKFSCSHFSCLLGLLRVNSYLKWQMRQYQKSVVMLLHASPKKWSLWERGLYRTSYWCLSHVSSSKPGQVWGPETIKDVAIMSIVKRADQLHVTAHLIQSDHLTTTMDI